MMRREGRPGAEHTGRLLYGPPTCGHPDSTTKEGLGRRGKRKQVWAQSCREGVRQDFQRRQGFDQTLKDNGLEGASGRCTRGKERGQRNTGEGRGEVVTSQNSPTSVQTEAPNCWPTGQTLTPMLCLLRKRSQYENYQEVSHEGSDAGLLLFVLV